MPRTLKAEQTGGVILELMNDAMRPLRTAAEPRVASGALHQSLQRLVDDGLTVVDDCVYFSELFDANPHLHDSHDLDPTGREALMNKLHLDDLVDTHTPDWVVYCVAQGRLLAERVLAAAAAMTRAPLDVAMSVDLGGTKTIGDRLIETYPSRTWRFYTRRDDGSAWLPDRWLAMTQEPAAVFRQA